MNMRDALDFLLAAAATWLAVVLSMLGYNLYVLTH